jgi:hypothetical protein
MRDSLSSSSVVTWFSVVNSVNGDLVIPDDEIKKFTNYLNKILKSFGEWLQQFYINHPDLCWIIVVVFGLFVAFVCIKSLRKIFVNVILVVIVLVAVILIMFKIL